VNDLLQPSLIRWCEIEVGGIGPQVPSDDDVSMLLKVVENRLSHRPLRFDVPGGKRRD